MGRVSYQSNFLLGIGSEVPTTRGDGRQNNYDSNQKWLVRPMNDTEVCAWLARYNSTSQMAAARVWRTLADDAAALLLPVEAESVRPTAARAIVDATAHYYNVLPAVILGDSRRKLATRARHVAIWLCAKHCREMSLPDLGAFFGRDHTTIYAARTKIEAELKVDSSLPLVMRAIEAML